MLCGFSTLQEHVWSVILSFSCRDLLLMMNLTHEYNVARTHVRNVDITFLAEEAGCNGKAGPVVHLFENVIRYLGGFLSAYE